MVTILRIGALEMALGAHAIVESQKIGSKVIKFVSKISWICVVP
jgi:hypothetical protein